MNNLLSNIADWVPMVSSDARPTIKVSNGFSAGLAIEVQEYIPIDNGPLMHIIWRTIETETAPRQV